MVNNFCGQSCEEEIEMPSAGGLAVFLTEAPEEFFKGDPVRLGRLAQQSKENGKPKTCRQPVHSLAY